MEKLFSEAFDVMFDGCSQEEIAQICEASQSQVSDWKRGIRKPGHEHYASMAKKGYNPLLLILGMGPVWLKDLGIGYLFPAKIFAVAEKLVDYPTIVGDMVELLKAHDKMERAKENLAMSKQKLKGKA